MNDDDADADTDGRHRLHNEQEFIGFDAVDIDFPQLEHKEQKRSDPAAKKPNGTTQQQRQNEYRETITSSSSQKSHQVEKSPPEIVASSTGTNHQQQQHNHHHNHNINYDKVLLTLQNQYIPTLPKVIITASASVSDGSGKKLNYSVGNVIGPNIKIPPSTYDEYKEDDVVLDPFYLDVLKIKPRRFSRDLRTIAEAEK